MANARTTRTILLALCMLLACAHTCLAGVRLKNICRVKGQEENTLQGLGLVVGLKGTGDGGEYLPTIRSLALAMQLMGNQLGTKGPLELKDAKNVALVLVTATVPAAGARQGDKLNCTVSSVGSSKSLLGGTLFVTPLQGPQVKSQRVYALAQGGVELDDRGKPTVGMVHDGCRVEEDFFNPYIKNNKITLVLDKNHADFQIAQDVAELLNGQPDFNAGGIYPAKALNQANIEVRIPPEYRDEPVLFVSAVMASVLVDPKVDARVVVNPRTGSVVISGDVEIGAAVVTHKGIVVETGDVSSAGNRFVPIDVEKTSTAKLKSLVEALNAVKAPTADVVDILKGLERNGSLHGTLIIE